MRVDLCGRTDAGRARPDNEDSLLIADLTDPCVFRQAVALDRKIGQSGFLLVVADGMGGMAAGELASSMATDAICAHLMQPSPPKVTQPGRFAERLQEALETANRGIHGYSLAHPELRGMGTTATAAGLLGDSIYVAHVGDSRAYMIRDGRIRQLTQDQSLTPPLGATDRPAAGAPASNGRNVIVQALGPTAHVTVAMSRQRVQADDVVVVCSDGLSVAVSSAEIVDVVSVETRMSTACDRLIDLANERGGPDNITVILARVAR